MWNSNIKRYFLFTLSVFLLHFTDVYSTDSAKVVTAVAIDSSAIEVRKPNADTQKDLLNDPDYKYDRKALPSPNWWNRFWQWVASLFDDVSSTEGGRLTINVSYYIFVGAAIVIVVLLLLKNNIRALFYGKSASLAVSFQELEEDIHKINFNDLIASAITEKDYRKAVRLNFLKLLKELTDKNLITWKIDKTNNDYFIELSNSSYSKSFKELAFLYEHIWYGNFDIDETNFNTVLAKFNTLKV